MKRSSISVFMNLILIIYTIFWIFFTTGAYSQDFDTIVEGELLCFGLIGTCLFWSYLKSYNSKRNFFWKQVLAFMYSGTYTMIVFCINNVWRYIQFNTRFQWNDPLELQYFLRYDITYSVGLGEYRYVAVFAIMFIICELRIIASIPKVKQFLEQTAVKVHTFFTN